MFIIFLLLWIQLFTSIASCRVVETLTEDPWTRMKDPLTVTLTTEIPTTIGEIPTRGQTPTETLMLGDPYMMTLTGIVLYNLFIQLLC